MPDDLTGAERAEYEAIRARHQSELARVGRPTPPRAVSLAELEEHAGHAAGLSAAGVVFGPDTSEYQGSPAWPTVKASGCALGFYKVSEGRTYQDPSHQWSRSRVPNAGLVPGGYHFLYYSDEYASRPALWGAQAAFFCSLVDPHAGHFLDVEAAATAGHHLGVREWVAEYRKLFPGHPLGCYANQALWANRSRMPYDPTGLFDYVWHAGVGNGYYTSATGTISQQWAGTGHLSNSFATHGYPTVRLWQITDHAKVPGVGGSFCDGNAFQGTTAELKALLTTGGSDDMSQADVDAVLKGVKAMLEAIPDSVGGRVSYRDTWRNPSTGKDEPLTWDRIMNEMMRRSDDPRDLTAAGRDALAAQLGKVDADTLAQAKADIIDGVVGQLEAGVHVDATDPKVLGDLLGQQLDEHLGKLRITTAQ